MIHENSSRKYIQTYLIISLKECESKKYEMIINETIHIPTRGQ